MKDCPVRIESSNKRVALPVKTQNSRKIGARDAANFPCRYPIFRKMNTLARFKKCVRFLIAEKTALNFNVSAVIVRKRLPPVQTFRIHTPGPDFLGGNLLVLGKMHDAGPGSRM